MLSWDKSGAVIMAPGHKQKVMSVNKFASTYLREIAQELC